MKQLQGIISFIETADAGSMSTAGYDIDIRGGAPAHESLNSKRQCGLPVAFSPAPPTCREQVRRPGQMSLPGINVFSVGSRMADRCGRIL